MPLALEIAAGLAREGLGAWLDSLDAEEQAPGVDRLQAALQRSWAGLPADCRRLLQQLSQLEAPLSNDQMLTLPGATPEAVHALTERSLLCHEQLGWRVLRPTKLAVARIAPPTSALRNSVMAWLASEAERHGRLYPSHPRIAARTGAMLQDFLRVGEADPALAVRLALALADILWERDPRALCHLLERAHGEAPDHPVLANHLAWFVGGERALALLRVAQGTEDPVLESHNLSLRRFLRLDPTEADFEALLDRLDPHTAAHFSLRNDLWMIRLQDGVPSVAGLAAFDQLVTELRASPWIPETAMAWIDLARLQLRHGVYQISLRTAESAAAFCADHHLWSSAVWAGYVAAKALGRVDRVRGAAGMAQVARSAEQRGQSSLAADARLHQGFYRMASGDLDGAQSCFHQANRPGPVVTSAAALLGLAAVLVATGRPEEAQRTRALVKVDALKMPRQDGTTDPRAALLCFELHRARALGDVGEVGRCWAELEPLLPCASDLVLAWCEHLRS